MVSTFPIQNKQTQENIPYMDPIGYIKNDMFCQNFVMLLSFAFARIVISPKLVRQESEEAANCPICCGRLKHCVALIPCGHAFCKACVHPSCTQERFSFS